MLRSSLRRGNLTQVILWKIVNSLGDDTQFYDILDGGTYYKSHKRINVMDLPRSIHVICLFVPNMLAIGLSGNQ